MDQSPIKIEDITRTIPRGTMLICDRCHAPTTTTEDVLLTPDQQVICDRCADELEGLG